MNIVVLDGYVLNPGDISWSPLEQLGDLKVYDRTMPEDVLERARDAQVILTNKTILTAKTIEQLPHLEYIGVLATGYNVVDLAAATGRRITVTNIPGYSTDSVVQTVFAHLLNYTHHIALHDRSVKNGEWTNCLDFSYTKSPLIELAGLTFGIIGFGQIGRAVADVAKAFKMNVIVSKYKSIVPLAGVELVSLEDMFRRSDFLSLHCPLNDQTHHLINQPHLDLMKPSAFLINTGRGPLIDEPALADALNSNRIAAAALDVLDSEPPKPNNPLLSARNCYITPHIAWASQAARIRCIQIAAENINAFLLGAPINTVA